MVTDLDGTLLNSAAALSSYSARILTAALEAGHVISFATARSIVSAASIVKDVPWKHPVIVYNGALVLNPRTRAILAGRYMPAEIALGILEKGRSLGLTPFFYLVDPHGGESAVYEVLRNDGEKAFRQSRMRDPRYRRVERIEIEAKQRVVQLNYVGPKALLDPLHTWVAETYKDDVNMYFFPDTYLKGHYFMEIYHPKASKKEALKLWASLVGCRTEEIVVFGDNLNDLGLFEAAGLRVAVQNAHSNLKRTADRLTLSNDQDGVARFVADLISNEQNGRRIDAV